MLEYLIWSSLWDETDTLVPKYMMLSVWVALWSLIVCSIMCVCHSGCSPGELWCKLISLICILVSFEKSCLILHQAYIGFFPVHKIPFLKRQWDFIWITTLHNCITMGPLGNQVLYYPINVWRGHVFIWGGGSEGAVDKEYQYYYISGEL